ncbi:hypothetical protein G6O69_21370 [Pseudenhygromyxa sp. WMMC2535]|uniref:hypothetical protein n=1 Tax=Pseudenhygromyxa sp. WMMC2535 TaxID=2712867 RepID=UPI0015557F71|nr:hypothetical protein [Pseudenhygromyxa sp. WMMC2535]NVB40404.1 hypothetical protein [Pseudenhygromyxa sp. WMMC2535]
MQLSLVMIQGDLDDDEVEAIFADSGYRDCEVIGEPVPGIAVLGLVEDERDRRPDREYLRHCRDQGWTVLSDESGRLALRPSSCWTKLAIRRGVRVVVIHGEPDPGMRAFALHFPDGRRRAVAVSEDEREEIGDPLAIEAAFASGRLHVDDLITLVQSLGLDFERLNVLPPYTVTAAAAAAAC